MSQARLSRVYNGVSLAGVLALAGAGVWALTEPRHPRERSAITSAVSSAPVGLEGAPTLGEPSAPLGLVIFSDFQCPFCRGFARQTMPALIEQYVKTGKVFVAFRHLPLDAIHGEARRAATLAECARRQGRFWQFHDALFADARGLDEGWVTRVSGTAGIPGLADACPAAETAERVRRDEAAAALLGVRSTPTLVLGPLGDGSVQALRVLPGFTTAERLAEEIESLLDSGKSR
jgi:protein-disulfide isomerase